MDRTIRLSIAASIALSLGGCGGSSNSNEQPAAGTTPTSKTVSVIDGYLSNAKVHVDRNANGIAESDEYVAASIDGRVTIPVADISYNLIATVDAKDATDSDRIGYVPDSYQLTATSSDDVVSPFTTLAMKPGMTSGLIAGELGLSQDKLFGDYVALKATNNDAIMAHALARSLTTILNNSTPSEQMDALQTAKQMYQQHQNQNNRESINTITVDLSNSSAPAVFTNYPDAEAYFGSNDEWHLTSLNNHFSQDEGVQTAEFNTTSRSMTLYDAQGVFKKTEDYLFDDMRMVTTGGVNDVIVLTHRDIAVTRTGEKNDIVVWSATNLSDREPMLLANTDFAAQTWYLVFDDSSNSTANTINAELTFATPQGSPTATVSITDPTKSFDSTYYVTTESNAGKIVSPLYINLEDGELPLRLLQVVESEGVKLFFETNREVFMLMTLEQGIAERLTD